MKDNVVFLQVSHKLTAPSNPCLDYYEQVYPKQYGYAIASEHYMELPTWIAVANGLIDSNVYAKTLHVVQDVEETVKWLDAHPWNTTVLASVMDVNVGVLQDIMSKCHFPKKWVVGGYVDFKAYEWHDLVVVLDSIYDLHHAMPGVRVEAAPDYSIFGDAVTIPRLTLSEGCWHNCAFCTISRDIVERSWEDVFDQVDSFRGMNFSLVYVNDKTFGQASNCEWLEQVAEYIWTFNDDFVGFIVQTTVQEARKNIRHWVVDLNVMYVEVGVEHVDAEYLRRMRKPYSLAMLDDLTWYIRSELKGTVGFIPNLMFALPDADYTDTLEWVEFNKDIIAFVNPFILCQYSTSKGELVTDATGNHDQDENSLMKSWLSDVEVKTNQIAMDTVFMLTGGE